MTIYVDDWQQRARVGRLNAVWSHLTCGPFDDLAELHEFAQRLGLQRRWFQDEPWPRQHYDVTGPKRQQAIALGAVPITWREAGHQMVRAKEALKQAPGQLVCARNGSRRTPSEDELWVVAKAIYELTSVAASPRPADGGVLF